MSFPKSKRFEEIKSCAPPPGAYDPKKLEHTPGVTIEKAERFKDPRDKDDKYGSDSSVDSSKGTATPKKMLFKTPIPAQQAGKILKKKPEEVADPDRLKTLKKELRTLAAERAEIDQRLAGREAEVTRLKARVQQGHQEKTSLMAKLATLERQVASMTKSNETLKTQVSASGTSQSKQKEVHHQLVTCQADVEKHSKEAKRLREELERSKTEAQAQLKKAKANCAKLEEESKNLANKEGERLKEIGTLTKELESLKVEKETIEEDREKIKKELGETVKEKEKQLKEVQNSLEGRITSLTEQELVLKTNIEQLTVKYQTLEENLACTQKEQNIKEEQLRREIQGLRMSLGELQAANDQLSAINAELMEKLNQEKEQCALLQEKLTAAECLTKEKFELLSNYLDIKSQEIDGLKGQLSETQSDACRLQSELTAAQEAAKDAVDAAEMKAASQVEELKRDLEQRSLEEQDLRWQLEKTMSQLFEYQELAEVRQEEVTSLKSQIEEAEKEAMEEAQEFHKSSSATIDRYRQQVIDMQKASAESTGKLQAENERIQSELQEQIKHLETVMSAAEQTAQEKIEVLNKQVLEMEEAHTDELQKLESQMADREKVFAKEKEDLHTEMEQAEESAGKEIQSLLSQLLEKRIQSNEVVTELKEQLREKSKEKAILEESSRRALEAEKAKSSQNEHLLQQRKAKIEQLSQELDTERANNACTVRRLEEELDKIQETLEEERSRAADLERQLKEAEGLLGPKVSHLEEELKKSSSQMDHLRKQVEEAEKVADTVEAASKAEVAEMQEAMETAKNIAISEIKELEKQSQAAQDEAQKQLIEVTNMFQDAQRQHDEVTAELNSRLKLRDDEIARLNRHLTDTQQVANAVKENCATLKAEMQRLQEEHTQEARVAQEAHEAAVVKLQVEHEAELERRNTESGAQHHVDLQQMIAAHQELQEKYEALRQLVGPFEEQLEALKLERQLLEGSKATTEQEISKLSDEYAQLLGHQNQKQKIKHIIKLKQDNNSLLKDLTNAREELAKQKRIHKRLEERIAQLEGKRRFDPPKAFQSSKENQTPPASPLRQGNRI